MTDTDIHPLDEIVHAQKRAQASGITSICSAHPVVLQAVFRHALQNNSPVLIESTCNQVNQFGGYTGMQPADFSAYVRRLAQTSRFPAESLILGGDHLGPGVWQDEPAQSAMAKSRRLVGDYVVAGYRKIHLDASMRLGDDPPERLSIETIARRTAEMARVAETACQDTGGNEAPRYVIGTEVPIPGGAREKEDRIQVSTVADTLETIEMTRRAFLELGLESAWERVFAVVVQPGVEFGDDFVIDYDRLLARGLSQFIEGQPLVYEAHSTDYQLPGALRRLVEDHFAILKVGPALTFAYREALFALARIEDALFPPDARSNLVAVLDRAMLEQPEHWTKHYHGNARELANARKYSFSDRSRYYWPVEAVQAAVQRLDANLVGVTIPLTMLSQYLPVQYERVRAGLLPNDHRALVQDRLFGVLDSYQAATTA